VQDSPSQIRIIAPFVFRIETDNVESYRAALGAAGGGIPLGMAMQALAVAPVASALREFLGEKTPLHIGQSYRLSEPLRAGVDYRCQVKISLAPADRLRVEQSLHDTTDQLCLAIVSDIAMVDA
jgi:hypothetical protein